MCHRLRVNWSWGTFLVHSRVGIHDKPFLGYHRNDIAGITNSARLVSDIRPRINYHSAWNQIVVHSVFISALVNSTKESNSLSPWSMILRAVSDETLITTQKYVLMIVTAAIFTYFPPVNLSLHAFLSRDAKEMNKMHFVHIFNVYSTVIYRYVQSWTVAAKTVNGHWIYVGYMHDINFIRFFLHPSTRTREDYDIHGKN